MANGKQRLELTWIGKENRPRLEPRILLEDPAQSYHAAQRVSANDIFGNRLIFGDNLLALKALEMEFTGRVKCIFIDPPYNTGSAFTHYDDGVEHSIWLSLMRDRLVLLKNLLSPDGSIWVSLDDNEAHYLKVLGDELFGRRNFLGNIVWQSKDTPGNNSTGIAQTHNHVLGWQKEELFSINRLSRSSDQDKFYSNPDSDVRGPWLGTPLTRAEHRDRDFYSIDAPDGRKVFPPKGSSWRRPAEIMKNLELEKRIWWGVKGDATFPKEKKFLTEVKQDVVNQTWWPYDFAGSTRNASVEMKGIFGQKSFDTPKPEKLILRVLAMSTAPGDLVLDSFAGSGTTGAVAQKMGRRWIMIELGEHIHSHIIPRMKKVIDGQDPGGVTEATGWKGGGGFRYFKLAPSLLELDRFGNHVISSEYNPAMLAEAMCKLMGFTFQPDEELYWQQGRSTETDFLYTTTQTLSRQQMESLSEEVGPHRTLMVCCSAFRAKAGDFPNLTLRKIPTAVLARCEWGKDDYSLNVQNLPQAPLPPDHPDFEPLPEAAHADQPPASPADAKRRRAAKKQQEHDAEPGLFGEASDESGGLA